MVVMVDRGYVGYFVFLIKDFSTYIRSLLGVWYAPRNSKGIQGDRAVNRLGPHLMYIHE